MAISFSDADGLMAGQGANAPLVGVNFFVRRQTAQSRFSHFVGSWGELLCLVAKHFSQAKPGYRDGVMMVPVPPERFFSGRGRGNAGDTAQGDV